MLILGIETATSQVGCALADQSGLLAAARSGVPRRHAESLAPQIDFVCRQAGVTPRDIRVVAVDIGPGLFTGLRVGMATALAFAHALGAPMVGVSSLDLVAFPARFTSRTIVAVLDARRGEVFHARYRPVPGGIQREGEAAVGRPDEVAAEITARGDETLVVGDGALAHREVFDGIAEVEIADGCFAHPTATALVELAHARAVREEFVRPDQIAPVYLRRPDAQAHWGDPVGGAA